MGKLYIKLMTTNIKNGKRFYFPYILAGAVIVVLFYNMMAIYYNDGLSNMTGGQDIKMIMQFGTVVVVIFSFIFIFYTNSFIMKRRKKDIGIYNILGMEKRHIAMEIFIETMVIAIIVIVCGLFTGILFDKFLMMLLYKILGFETSIKFTISVTSICNSLIVFIILYSLTMVYNVMQVKLSNPIELLRGGSVGEKEPKTKILMAIIGFVCIATGYYIAITTEDPIGAIMLFFVAVVLVIIGTYSLFTAGSIAFLKILRNNKNYYYKKKHFTAVSGMIYRMKQNAAGLSNICILSTMVLVMVSATVCIYIGEEDIIDNRYKSEINITCHSEQIEDSTKLNGIVENTIKENGRKITSIYKKNSISLMMCIDGNEFNLYNDGNDTKQYDFSKISYVELLVKEDFEGISDIKTGDISENEVEIYGTSEFPGNEVKIVGQAFKVNKSIIPDGNFFSGDTTMVDSCYVVVVRDYNELEKVAAILRDKKHAGIYQYEFHVDIDGTNSQKKDCGNVVIKEFADKENNKTRLGYNDINVVTKENHRETFYSLYGGLFFLGIFLGIMFLMITVLIIFYKQISEGYEDKERFIIMEKVGMSKKDVKNSIRSQIRTVFLLPIAMAIIHVAAAFPMIKRLLMLFGMFNSGLFIKCVLITIGVFIFIYIIVFMLTSRTYYKIVGEENR